MSAIAGIWNWNGQPITEAQINILAHHCRPIGSNDISTLMPIPNLALQTSVLNFDRLSTIEQQPWVGPHGTVVTWDGRLDNREDLLLTTHRELGAHQTDAAIVAAAYEKWGLDCLPRLLGDWSLAIWDSRQHKVILARDYMGNRPLHYLRTSHGLAWATSLDALVACFGLFSQPSETYIAERLTFGQTGISTGTTPFKGVRSVRASHVLTATQSRDISTRRYWRFSQARVRYRDSREYTSHLRELFTEAVRVRLRSNRTVWAHLSGGWDSSTVVCVANHLTQRGCAEAPRVQPVSSVISNSPESDESVHIAHVERWCRLKTVRREFAGYSRFAELLGHRHPVPGGPRFSLETPLWAAGDRIVLSGELGDIVMMRGERLGLLEPLHEGRPLRFLQLCLVRSRHKRRTLLATLISLGTNAYLPKLSYWLKRRSNPQLRPGANAIRAAAGYGLVPSMQELASQREMGDLPSVTEFPIVKRSLVSMLYRCAELGVASNTEPMPELWRTYPFAHRPLVEFVIAAPHLAFWHPAITRAGMRHAFEDVLPPETLQRTSKGSPTVAFARAATAWAEELANDRALIGDTRNWEIVKRGYVDGAAMTKLLDAVNPDDSSPHVFLVRCLHLEAWLRTLTAPLEHSTAVERPLHPGPSVAVLAPSMALCSNAIEA